MDSRDPVVVFFEKSVIQSITLLRKWDFLCAIVDIQSSRVEQLFKKDEKLVYALRPPRKIANQPVYIALGFAKVTTVSRNEKIGNFFLPLFYTTDLLNHTTLRKNPEGKKLAVLLSKAPSDPNCSVRWPLGERGKCW